MDKDSESFAERIGKAIARQRAQCKLTQDDVAERLGIGVEAVSRMERGKVMLTIERLAELADVFGCELAELVTAGSPRQQDQVQHLASLLSELATEDRDLVYELVKRLVDRLRNA